MAKIGILYCSYGNPEYLETALSAWISARHTSLFGHEYIISAVSLPFEEYKDAGLKYDDITVDSLKQSLDDELIDNLVTEPKFIPEWKARNLALQYLLQVDCDMVILWDSDEFAGLAQIEKMLGYVELNRFISWFKFSYRNYVFNDRTYLKEYFTPPRLFKVNTNGYRLKEIYWDNDAKYQSTMYPDKVLDYKELPNLVIPGKIVAFDHLTWISNDKSKRKVSYQMKHFGECSYSWNDERDCLEFNKDFYTKRNLTLPEIVEEKS